MRILHLTTFLQGGAGRIIVELAREQQRQGHDVMVVASRGGAPGYGNYQDYLETLAGLGMPVALVNSTFERTHLTTVAAATAIDRLIPAGREPDVIHSHAAVPSLIGLLVAGVRRMSVGVLQTMHGWGQAKTADQAATDVGVLNLVDRVVVPSTHSAALLTGLGVRPSHITIVPYGVPAAAQRLSEADEATWIAMARARHAGRLVIACVGTLGPRKNQTLLVEAVARLDRLNPLCVVVGEGDDRPLRQVVEHRRCGDRVRIHGYSASARALAAGADLLVLPSRREGQPISILEAFADGLIVATSDIPELVELVNPGVTGFHFRSDDAQSLADLIVRVAHLSNSDRRAIRVAARDRYTGHFTLTRMVERYGQVYATLRAKQPLPRRRATRPAA
jgi:glycosyltransferase involved in cell wall biosynthesis